MNPSHLAHCLAYRTHSWFSGFQKNFSVSTNPSMRHRLRWAPLRNSCCPRQTCHGSGISSLLGSSSRLRWQHSSMSSLGLASGNPILRYSASLQIVSMTHSVFHNWCPVEDTFTLPKLTASSRSALPALGHSLCVEAQLIKKKKKKRPWLIQLKIQKLHCFSKV